MYLFVKIPELIRYQGLSQVTSPEEDITVSSASLLLSPWRERTEEPLSASTPLHNGQKLDKNSNCEEEIHNGNGNLVAESTNSIDVLSAGESDAGDTLRSQKFNNSIASNMASAGRDTYDRGRRRIPTDFLYFFAKELLMTERTYKRDLELLTVTWSLRVSALASCGADIVEALGRPCLALEPLALSQGAFLVKLEKSLGPVSPARTDENEEPEYKKVAELLCEYLTNTYDAYTSYIARSGVMLARVESARRSEKGGAADAACESHDAACPLPLACLLLRPLHAVLHYRERVTELSQYLDSAATLRAQEMLHALCGAASEQLQHAENHAALCQLQRDIVGYDKLLVAEREFLRMGCVYKHSTKGLQQRMLFLFTDIMLFASKSSGGPQFRAHCALPLHSMLIEPSDLPHSFTIVVEESSYVISASNEQEYIGWCHAIEDAIADARERPLEVDTTLTPYEQEVVSSSSAVAAGVAGGAGGGALSHVCWHRATALSREHLLLANRTMLSGYLLRKFKKTHGWQKLWVALAAAALHFYKSWADDRPLVALPILGYSVGAPLAADGISKDFVFKLQFKNHVYFFRADSQYTYDRWTETLALATMHHNV